jgi:hypothetical protein
VIEPLAAGSAFEVHRIVDDETEVRLAAQDALNRAKLYDRFISIDTLWYSRRFTYQSAEHVLDDMLAVDPKRQAAVHSRRADVVAAVRAAAGHPKGELVLEQTMRADVMRKPEA